MAQAKNGAVQNPERAGLIICLNLVVPKKFNKCAYIVTAADKKWPEIAIGWLDGLYHANHIPYSLAISR